MSVPLDNLPVTQMLDELGTPLWWRARYGNIPATTEGLAPTPDPHSTAGIARCPVCYQGQLQRAQSTACTTCYGTGWTGGFAASVALSGMIVTGTYQLAMQPGGDLLSVAGVWLYTNPGDGFLLPQDLLVVQAAPGVRYLLGEQVQGPGLVGGSYSVPGGAGNPFGVAFVRLSQLLPLAPDHPLQAVPL